MRQFLGNIWTVLWFTELDGKYCRAIFPAVSPNTSFKEIRGVGRRKPRMDSAGFYYQFKNSSNIPISSNYGEQYRMRFRSNVGFCC
jgi:hypothetical protein